VKANPHESDAIHRFINEKAKQQVACFFHLSSPNQLPHDLKQ
jgi:hypothetical protein